MSRKDKVPLPPYVEYLLQAGSYPHPVEDVRLVQTHVSYLLFAGEYVYKWKKPVNLGFLDFSSLARRHHFCMEEVRLNRRLCPEMYLGVVPLTTTGSSFHLGGGGEVIEYAVKMVRLPDEAMMDRRIADGRLEWGDLYRIVDRLADFYAGCSRMTTGSRYGDAAAISRTVEENFAETGPYVGGAALSRQRFSRIAGWARKYLQKEHMFHRRLAEGYVRDCHGDLHSANICLTRRLEIFDCIEFNSRLRCTDIAADVAFLAMDLDYHGLAELSRQFIDAFVARSEDEGLLDLLDFYKCYRAYVRGKIGLLTSADPGVDEKAAGAALNAAERYFELAECYVVTAGTP